ncbi:phage head closure protein [Candidatus Pacearchaeota archaeon]|nr:phage head closure protein [Candidatus Pacearchaeota archaeon]
MRLLLNETITIKRSTDSFVKGRSVKGTTTTFTKKANIQPLKGNEILQLPEGDREQENMKCFLPFELQVNDEVIRSDGREYEVQESENWNVFGKLQHFKARIMLKERQ